MKRFNKYRKTIAFEVDKPKEPLCAEIINMTNGKILHEDTFKLTIKPSLFDPFAGRGIITLKLIPIKNDKKTLVECEIISTFVTERGIYIVISLLSLWTIVGLIISHSFGAFLTIVFGWLIFAIIIYLTEMLNQGKLENHVTYIGSRLKSVKHKSVA